MSGLEAKAVRAAGWGYAGTGAKLTIQLGTQILLARMLGPSEYGLFAIGSIIVSVSTYFADAGIGAVLVQSSEIDEPLVRYIGTMQLLAGLLVTVALILLAPWISAFFSQPRAVAVIRVMSLICLLNALASVPSNLLRRQLDFKALQLALVQGFFVGYILIAIPAAMLGFGVWSLVSGWICQALVNTILVWRTAKPSMGLQWRVAQSRQVMAFGGSALLSNLSTWAGNGVDKMVVGHYFPTAALGLYNTIGSLLGTAITAVLSTLQQVLFSASSRVAANPIRLKSTLLLTVEVGALILLPVFGVVAAIPDVILVGLYGPKWADGTAIVTPIALSTAFYGLAGLVTPLLWASGRVAQEGQIQLFGSIAVAICATVGALAGELVGVAWVVCLCVFIRAAVSIAYTGAVLGVKGTALLMRFRPGIICAGTTIMVALANHNLFRDLASVLRVSSLPSAILIESMVYCCVAYMAIRFTASDDLQNAFRLVPILGRTLPAAAQQSSRDA